MLSLTSLEMLFQSSHPNCSPWLGLLQMSIQACPGFSQIHCSMIYSSRPSLPDARSLPVLACRSWATRRCATYLTATRGR